MLKRNQNIHLNLLTHRPLSQTTAWGTKTRGNLKRPGGRRTGVPPDLQKKKKGSSVDHMNSTEKLLTGPHSNMTEHYTEGINAEVTAFISSKMVIN